jgi:predicted kinase
VSVPEGRSLLLAMAGLPGTGKSRLGQALAAALPAVILDKDPVRAALFPPKFVDYTTEQDDLCIGVILQVAGYLFHRHPGIRVILDGRPYVRRSQRQVLVDFAAGIGVPFSFIECVCTPEIAQARLQDAEATQHPARNRGIPLYQRLKGAFEPIEELKLVVDTGQALDRCLAECLTYIHTRLEPSGAGA